MKFIFYWGWLLNFFSLYEPIKKLPKFIFLGEGLLRFIFFWGRPFEIYFFLEKGLQIFFSRLPLGPPPDH